MELEQFIFWHIAIKRAVHVFNVLGHALAAAVVVDHDLEEIRGGSDGLQVLFRAINRVERVIVPDMPSDLKRGTYLFRFRVERRICVAQALSPHHFPGKKLGVIQH